MLLALDRVFELLVTKHGEGNHGPVRTILTHTRHSRNRWSTYAKSQAQYRKKNWIMQIAKNIGDGHFALAAGCDPFDYDSWAACEYDVEPDQACESGLR
jgi:hypothetical protein